MIEPTVAITPRVLGALPESDLALETPAPLVSYTHRRLADADIYFVFNSGDNELATQATLAGSGVAKSWDANTGASSEWTGAVASNGHVRVPLKLAPWSTTLVVIEGKRKKS